MWLLYILLVLPLTEAAVLTHEAVDQADLSESWNPADIAENIQDEMGKIANEFLHLVKAARSPDFSRQKREVDYLKTSLLMDDKGVYRLRTIRPYHTLCARPTDIVFVDVGNSSVSICLSLPVHDTPGSTNVAQVTVKSFNPLNSWYSSSPESAVSFYNSGRLYILVADSGRGDGTDLIQFNLETKQYFVDHTVHSKYATAIALWKMKMDGSFHLAIANSNGDKEANDLRAEIYTYNWLGTYFDKYSSMTAYDVRDIEPFHIHSKAYLAVANHRRGKDNYHVDSEIFKYNLDQKKWLSHQRIRTYGAMDWEFFTHGSSLGKEFFLAVANFVEQGNYNINSMIYKFVKDKFVPFQCILTSGATSIASFSDGSIFLLAVANEFAEVNLYQYDGWSFVPASVQFTQSTMSSGVKSVSFHTLHEMEQKKLFLAVSNPVKEGASLYEMDFVYENSLKKWHDKSEDWCFETLEKSENSESGILKDMKNVYYIDQMEPIVIDGSLRFMNGLKTSTITTPKLINVKNEKIYDQSVLLKLMELKERLSVVEEKVKRISDVLRNAVTIDGNQTLTGNYVFKDSTIVCQNQNSCKFEAINTTILNGEEISDLESKVIFLDQDDFINGVLNVENIKANSISVLGLIDGINVSNIVTKSGNHVITGVKTFGQPIKTENVEVSGLINGISVSPQTVLLSGMYQNITGNLTFVDVDTSSLDVTGKVNGVDLDRLYSDLVLPGKSYIVTGQKTFSDIAVQNIVMMNRSTLNGVDLTDLWKNILWIDGFQEISAPMTFSTINLEKDLLVPGVINGIKIPGPEVLLLNSNLVIVAPQTFKETTNISRLEVTQSINGINVLKSGSNSELDILLMDTHQIITGKKVFKTIYLNSHSYVSGTVDGVDLSEFKDLSMYTNSTQILNRNWVFKNLIARGPLIVHGLTSGSNLSDVYENAVKLNDTVLPNFHFKGYVEIEDLHTESINGLDVTKDLVLVNMPQTIKGQKFFQNLRLEADSSVLGSVNDLDLSFLNKTLLIIGDQTINVPMILPGSVKVKAMNVKGVVNNVDFSDIVMLNEFDNITGYKTLVNPKFEGVLHADEMDVSGLINNIKIEEMVQDTMTYDDEQTIYGAKTINGSLIISKDSNLQTDSLNGIDISELWNDTVRVDIPQIISGKKTFTAPVSFTDLAFYSTIDGVTEADLKHNWLYRDGDQEIFEDVTFVSDVTVRSIDANFVNEMNITHLDSIIAKKNEPIAIASQVTFGNVFSYNVTLSGKIQGIDLSEEAIFKNAESETVITGKKIFSEDIKIHGNLTVVGLINKISIEEMCTNVVPLDKNEKLHSLTVVGNVTFKRGIEVGGKLSGLDIDTLNTIYVKSDDGTIFLSGLKTFQTLTIDGPVKMHGKHLGGVDLKFFNSTYMSVSREQAIAASIRFDNIKLQGDLSADNFYTHDNKINDVDIVQLENNILKVTGSQAVTASYRFDIVEFEEDLMVVGKVNGIEIPKGLMLKNGENHIYNPKIFEKDLTILGDLNIEEGKTIQGVDVSEWQRKAILKEYEKYQIEGAMTFGNLYFKDVRANSLIDNVRISGDSLLLIYGDQTIAGQKTFSNVTVLGNVTLGGLINQIDIVDLAMRAARSDRENTITGIKRFNGHLTIGNLETGLVNGVDVSKLNKSINAHLKLKAIETPLSELQSVLSTMKDEFQAQAVILQYYDYYQGFNIPGAYTWLYVKGPNDWLMLSDLTPVTGCTTIKIFTYDENNENFNLTGQVLASSAIAMRSIRIWDSTFLLVANQVPNTDCVPQFDNWEHTAIGNRDLPGHIYKWDDQAFKLHQNVVLKSTTDVAVFGTGTDELKACAVYAEEHEVNVYCAEENGKKFTFRETLSSTRFGKKLSIIENDSGIMMLAVAGYDVHNPNGYGTVDLYHWDQDTDFFRTPKQTIQCSYPKSVMFMMCTKGFTQHFLVISEGSFPHANNVPRILIYLYDFNKVKLVKYQEIEDYGDLEYMILPNKDLIFYVLNTKIGKINIYKYKNASGFVKLDIAITTGGHKLHSFIRNIDDDMHYLAIAGPRRQLPQNPEDTGLAEILISKIKGRGRPL